MPQKKTTLSNAPPVIRFPQRCRQFEPELRERGVPHLAFQFRKLDLGQYLQPLQYQAASSQEYKVSVPQQTRALDSLTKKIFKPRLIIVGTEAGGMGYPEATRMLLWLFLQAYQKQKDVNGTLPLWYPVYNNRDRRLLERQQDAMSQHMTGFDDPSMLVLDNLYVNSNMYVINKAQEIINHWRYSVPVFVLVSGCNALEFGFKQLHIQASYYLQIGSGRKVISV